MSVLPVDQQPGMTERLTLTANGPAGLSGVEPSSGEQGSFLDFIDIINPLQHIPVVNTIYRELTGDTIKPVPALVGGTLFGGPIGFAAAMANMAVEDQTGKTVDQHLVSLFKDEPETTAIAAAAPPPAPPPPPPPAADEPPLPEPAPRPVVIAFNGTTPQDETALSGSALFMAAQELAAVPPAPVAPPTPTPVAAATPVIAAPAGPLAGDPRFMPLPSREARMMPLQRPSGPVSVAPPPQAAASPDAAAIRRAIAAQGLTDTSHPLLQATEDGGQDWFSNGMMANLDRYKAAGAPR